jgi:death-on-curing protein
VNAIRRVSSVSFGRRGGLPANSSNIPARRRRKSASGRPLTLRACRLALGNLLCYNICMNTQLKITKIGNSAGVVLPKELLSRLRVGPGDTLYATEAPDGVRPTPISKRKWRLRSPSCARIAISSACSPSDARRMTAKRVEPVWLDIKIALAVHDRQLAEHGGGDGVRDAAMLESALAQPINRWGYGEDDRSALAAAYAFGIARNHPFVDGNKRTVWVFARLFLALNGVELSFTPQDAIRAMMGLAAGEISEDALADWFRERAVG